MTLFRNQTHQEVWIEHWCRTCFEPHEAQRRLQGKPTMCPILGRALASIEQAKPRKPPEWERNTRADEMHRTLTCTSYQPKPPHVRKTPHATQQYEDVPMFDVEPGEAHLIPVEGWPERPARKKDVDHA